MAEFKISRELVQELAEEGAAQLKGLVLPDLEYEFGSYRLSHLADNGELYELGATIKNILDTSGFGHMDPITHLRTQTAEVLENDANNIRKEPDLLHPYYSNSKYGLSIIWARGGPREQGLYVAGRGPRPDTDKMRFYRYANGPVAIALRNFGTKLSNRTSPLGSVWHEGYRLSPGELCVAETFYNELDPSLQRTSQA